MEYKELLIKRKLTQLEKDLAFCAAQSEPVFQAAIKAMNDFAVACGKVNWGEVLNNA